MLNVSFFERTISVLDFILCLFISSRTVTFLRSFTNVIIAVTWVRLSVESVSLCVCVSMSARALKGKRLELSTPKSVEM